MNTPTPSNRRRRPRHGSVRRVQGGAALRGVVVATGIVAAVVLQLTGPRLQCGLADLVGVAGVIPAAAMLPASTPSCGWSSTAFPMHPCKVATAAAAGVAPVI
jgi:hypothetical protein